MKLKDNPDYQDVQDILWYHMQKLIDTVRGEKDDAHSTWDSDVSKE